MRAIIKLIETLKANSSSIIILIILLMYDYAAVYTSAFGFNKKILLIHVIFNANSVFVILLKNYFQVLNKYILNILTNFYCFNVFTCIICLWILALPNSDQWQSFLLILMMIITATKLFIEVMIGVKQFILSIQIK